jgi:hypothetical protein
MRGWHGKERCTFARSPRGWGDLHWEGMAPVARRACGPHQLGVLRLWGAVSFRQPCVTAILGPASVGP